MATDHPNDGFTDADAPTDADFTAALAAAMRRPLREGAENAVRQLLAWTGEDVDREGLLDTPKRHVKALSELTEGYGMDPATILGTTFDGEHYDEMVVVRGVEFMSLCEHHVLPFIGHVTVGYVPNERVVGLSKIPRLVECFARRLQIQERFTQQIASALMEHLQPEGVGVIVSAEHSCMRMRGVKKRGEMVTSAMLGSLRTHPEQRAELLALHRREGTNW